MSTTDFKPDGLLKWRCKGCKTDYAQSDGSLSGIKNVRAYNAKVHLSTPEARACGICAGLHDGAYLSKLRWCTTCKWVACGELPHKCCMCRVSSTEFLRLGDMVGFF